MEKTFYEYYTDEKVKKIIDQSDRKLERWFGIKPITRKNKVREVKLSK